MENREESFWDLLDRGLPCPFFLGTFEELPESCVSLSLPSSQLAWTLVKQQANCNYVQMPWQLETFYPGRRIRNM
ncbi:hypothetical protein AGIG_G24077 [Arapaima gigas]